MLSFALTGKPLALDTLESYFFKSWRYLKIVQIVRYFEVALSF